MSNLWWEWRSQYDWSNFFTRVCFAKLFNFQWEIMDQTENKITLDSDILPNSIWFKSDWEPLLILFFTTFNYCGGCNIFDDNYYSQPFVHTEKKTPLSMNTGIQIEIYHNILIPENLYFHNTYLTVTLVSKFLHWCANGRKQKSRWHGLKTKFRRLHRSKLDTRNAQYHVLCTK